MTVSREAAEVAVPGGSAVTTNAETVTDGSASMLPGDTDSRGSDPKPELVLQDLVRLLRRQQVCSARVSSSEDLFIL